MANIIKPKRTSTPGNVPTTSNLASGELGVNMADKKIYINNGTSIVEIGSGTLAGLTDVSGVTGTGSVVQATAPTVSGEWGTFSGIKFNTSPSIIPTVGEAYWNSTQQGLEIQMDSNVSGTINQDGFYYIKASSAITKGQVCMFTGSVGASGVLTAAPASGTIDGLIVMGIAAESIALNGFGYIQATGTLTGINTSSFTAGAILYYDPTVTGGLTATQPAKNATQTVVAAVINSNNNGSIFVRLTYFPEFGDLANVSLSTPSTGQALYYNGTNWVNGTLPIAGGGTNSTATPTSGGVGYGTGTAHAFTSAGTTGQVLTSNGASAPTWNNVTATPAGSTGQIQYNNAGALGALSSGTSGQVLVSGGTGVAPAWANKTTYLGVLLNSGSTTQVPTSNGYIGILLNSGSTTQVPIN